MMEWTPPQPHHACGSIVCACGIVRACDASSSPQHARVPDLGQYNSSATRHGRITLGPHARPWEEHCRLGHVAPGLVCPTGLLRTERGLGSHSCGFARARPQRRPFALRVFQSPPHGHVRPWPRTIPVHACAATTAECKGSHTNSTCREPRRDRTPVSSVVSFNRKKRRGGKGGGRRQRRRNPPSPLSTIGTASMRRR